ncbi:MAG: hypothetical protein ACKVZJ_14825 [Phycisphaerales bacterium]
MPPLGDPERPIFLAALSEWKSAGGIVWEPAAAEWVRLHLKHTQRDLGEKLFEYAKSGGQISKVRETRENWRDLHEFHYDIVLPFEKRRVYVEMRLISDSRVNPPHIHIVNVHWSAS